MKGNSVLDEVVARAMRAACPGRVDEGYGDVHLVDVAEAVADEVLGFIEDTDDKASLSSGFTMDFPFYFVDDKFDLGRYVNAEDGTAMFTILFRYFPDRRGEVPSGGKYDGLWTSDTDQPQIFLNYPEM